MKPFAEFSKFIFDLTKILLMIIALLLFLFVIASIADGLYWQSVFACPDRRVRFTDEEAISFAKIYLRNKNFDPRVTTSMDYNKSYQPLRPSEDGWRLSRKPPSNFFQAEEIELNFSGREDDAFLGCSLLACGVMLGCDRHYFSLSE